MAIEPFVLQFNPQDIPALSAAYEFQNDERLIFDAGEKIKLGQYTLTHLKTIHRWKTNGRGISRLGKNRPEEVEEALKFATAAETPRAAVAVLCGLSGSEVPVASAVLTAIKPEVYTIIDFR